jgi:hypothetical protein
MTIHLLIFGMSGQELIWIFFVLIVVVFLAVSNIKRNVAIKAENQILKKRLDYNALHELDKLKQSDILSEAEFKKRRKRY